MANDFLSYALREMDRKERNGCYYNDIRMWAKDKLGISLWSKQVEIANALIKHRRVAVKSGHGVGKSFLASLVGAWFSDTRQEKDSIIVSTAPTQPQLEIVWGYMQDHHHTAGLFGKITQDHYWKSDLGKVRGFGRKPSNTNIHAFQGIHRRDGVLAILDESCGIPESIFTAVDAITTGRNDMVLSIGNPDDINTPFGKIWSDAATGASWHKMTISSYDSPNLTGEDFPESAKDGLVTAEWIEGRKLAWGEDSPRFKSKVLGEFSEGSADNLFSMSDILKGHTAEIEAHGDEKPRLGCDIARYGADDTVIYSYHSGHVRKVGQWNKTDLVTTAEKIAELAFELGADEVRIDGVGVGAGVVDNLARIADNRFQVINMVGNSASPDLKKWFNARAYWYDSTREKMFKQELDIEILDKELSEELGDVQYHFKNPRGSLQIEKKEDIRYRTGKSPDFADAFIYACADLGFDPTDPLHSLEPGQEFELDIEQILWDIETTIGPC